MGGVSSLATYMNSVVVTGAAFVEGREGLKDTSTGEGRRNARESQQRENKVIE